MNSILLISFIGTVLVIGVTPGPSVLRAAANSVSHGSKKTVGTILGDLTANSFQIILSSLGLASIVVFFAALFPLFIDQSLAFAPQVTTLGIIYLCIDGICLLTYVRFALSLKGYLESKEKIHLQNKIVGALLIFSGLMLSTIRRANN